MDKAYTGFGTEGIPTLYPNWAVRECSKTKLLHVLKGVQKCIDCSETSELNPSTLIEYLGNRNSYNVGKELAKLRGIPHEQKTIQQKLLQRTFSLLSYDGLNPVSVGNVAPSQVYSDLYLDEPALQPKGTFARGGYEGSERDLTFPIFEDDSRRIKIHVYGMHATDMTHDDGAHEHYGVGGSLVLKGCLINTHVNAVPVADEKDAECGLYNMEKEESAGSKPRVVFKKVHSVHIAPVTSHGYDAGDYYYLPAPNGHGSIDRSDLVEQEKLYMHHAKALPNTVTLFTQDVSDAKSLLTTFPKGTDPVLDKATSDIRNVISSDRVRAILDELHPLITAELSSAEKAITPLDRTDEMGTEEGFRRRLGTQQISSRTH